MSEPPSDAVLLIQHPDGTASSAVLPSDGRPVVIGRTAGVQVFLDHAQVSRRHAELFRDPIGRWHVRDLESRNGTRVNGRRVLEHALAPGDRVGVGEHTLTLPFESGTTNLGCARPGDGASGAVRVADEPDPMPIRTLGDLAPPKLSAEHLTQLTSLSRTLLALPDPRLRADGLCGMLVGPTLRGLSAVVLRLACHDRDPDPQTLGGPCLARKPGDRGDTPDEAGKPLAYVSRGVLRAVCERRTAVLASNAAAGGAHPGVVASEAMELSIDPRALRAAAVACPLRESAGMLDLLYAVFPPECGTGEWLALVALAAEQYQQAEAAWDARARAEAQAALERELERARSIQLRLVPDEPRLAPFRALGLDIAIRFLPSRWVGGDYVDVLSMKDGRVLLALADVAGKGMPAALVASSVHSMIHMGAAAGLGLADLFASLNDHLRQTLADGEFVTMAAVALDPRTGAAECLNMGHPPPLVVSPGGEVRRLQHAEHAPLGIEPDPPRPALEQIAPGHLLVLYSDGLTEMSDESGAQWGIDGLEQAIASLCREEPAPASALAESLNAQAEARRGPRAATDDRSCLLARR